MVMSGEMILEKEQTLVLGKCFLYNKKAHVYTMGFDKNQNYLQRVLSSIETPKRPIMLWIKEQSAAMEIVAFAIEEKVPGKSCEADFALYKKSTYKKLNCKQERKQHSYFGIHKKKHNTGSEIILSSLAGILWQKFIFGISKSRGKVQ